MSDSFDKEISSLYRQASQDQPPAHLDDAVLALAKREAQSKPKVVSPFGGRWTLPFSLAAVIVLSVSVITLVEKESPPRDADIRETLSPSLEAPSPAVPEEKALMKEKAFEKEKALANEKALVKEKKFADADKEAPMEEKTATRPLLSSKSKKKPRSRQEHIEASPEMLSARKPIQPSPAPKEEKAAAGVIPAKPSKSLPSSGTAPAAPATMAESTDAGQKAKQIMSESDNSNDLSQQRREPLAGPQTGQSQALARKAPPSSPPPDTEVSTSQLTAPSLTRSFATQETSPPCGALTANQCLQSPQCTYVRLPPGQGYQCRKAVTYCEQGFVQYQGAIKGSGKASCESKPRCRFIPGDCECRQGQECDCQGKNPPHCKEK